MVVTFFRIEGQGAKQIGTIQFSGIELSATGEGKDFLPRLLRGVEQTDHNAVRTALQNAPKVYNGSYVRASIEGEMRGTMRRRINAV